MMKKIIKRIVLILIAIAAIAAIVFLVVIRKNTYRFIKVENFEGKVRICRNEEKSKVTEGQLLINNDEVSVPEDGLLELLVDNDKHIVASPDTEFIVKATGIKSNGKVSINVTKGDALFTIDNKLGENSEFEVSTPNATFSVRGTTFNVSYDEEDNRAELNVLEGTVAVNNGKDEYMAEAGSKVIVDDNGIRDLTDFSSVNIGDHVFFGEYEQDGNNQNGKESIEWSVLDKDDDSLLLISSYGLDTISYGQEGGATTKWGNSYIREWLNDDFYSEAFNEKEANKILLNNTSNVINNWDYGLGSDEADTTKDYVFLLSEEELETYFYMNEVSNILGMYNVYSQAAICEPVQKLIDEETVEVIDIYQPIFLDFGYTEDCVGMTSGSWWLRNTYVQLMGGDITVLIVDGYGRAGDNNTNGLREDIMVRPVIRVSID